MIKCGNESCDRYNSMYLRNCESITRSLKSFADCKDYKSFQESFDAVVERRCRKIKAVLASKAEEYASDNDRMHNFNVAAEISGETPEKALHGMLLKHIVSVMDLIDQPEKRTEALIDEKIGDNINYLILLEGMMRSKL